MENQHRYWSWFINQRLEKLGPGKIDQVLKDITAEQEMCRRNTHYLLAEFKKWDPSKEACYGRNGTKVQEIVRVRAKAQR